MARQTRRSRAQHPGTRKRADSPPVRHPHLRTEPLAVEPDIDSALPGGPTTPEYPEALAPARPAAPAAAGTPFRSPSPFRPAAPGGRRVADPALARIVSTDYGYVVGELKRIFTTALIVVALLVIVALIKS